MRSKNAIVLLAVVFATHAHAGPSLQELGELTAPEGAQSADISAVRAATISGAAMDLGTKAGVAARTEQILAMMDKRASALDKIYRFSAWVRANGILPPVITEARDAVVATNNQIRVQDRIYKIVAPAKLVHAVAPTWRDYLLTGLTVKVPTLPTTSAAYPKNSQEREYWKRELKKGWDYGQKLADEILERNWARLDRDYTGILLYVQLLQEGKVEEPKVAVAPQTVSGNREQLIVGDTLYRITDTGGFVTDPKKWNPTVLPEVEK